MTATETVDLFSFDTRRQRVVDWQAPRPVAKAATGMSGLETMRAIRDGILPPPPMARLIGFETDRRAGADRHGTGSRREPRK